MRTTRKNHLCWSQEHPERSHFSRQHRSTRSGTEVFKCRNCRRFIGPLPSGGHHRNHCPFCLFSRHVDLEKGDRLNVCGAKMRPIGYFQRPNGEYVLVHQCLGCDFERFNRIAADDDFALLLTLPVLPARTSREVKEQRLQAILQEWPEDSKDD